MRCLDANDVVRFLDGEESPAAADAFESHIDQCADCRALVTELGRAIDVVDESPGGTHSDWQARSGAEVVDPGTQIDRYVVSDVLGSGAMGVVYRAHDPELDRDVALKLVRVLGNDALHDHARRRLLREAQAMARLAHPNVVAVHDASIVGSFVFVAMELVEGIPLDEWLSRAQRPWTEITRVFADAGRGLAAAHAAGIVHRDFKPSNVLVGNDGRTRVTDFGLAVVGADEAGARVAGMATGSPDAASRLTATGTLLGTPAYMSPEVREGKSADTRSDQYSFAVALVEALTGDRNDPVAAVARAPRPLRPILARALQRDPAARYPAMDALVAALTRARVPGWRRAVPAVAVGLVAVAAYGGYRLAAGDTPAGCAPPDEAIAKIWNPERKAAIRSAFQATGVPRVDEIFEKVEHSLDDFTKAYRAEHVEACAATRVRGEQSSVMLQVRHACLEGELAYFGALTDVLVKADASVAKGATRVADLTERLAHCRDVAALDEQLPPPSDPKRRARLAAATNELARIEFVSMRGKFDEALADATKLLAEARALAYAPLEADVLAEIGNTQWRKGDTTTAVKTLYEAVDAAKRGHAADVEAGALMTLVAVLGFEEARHEEALHVARLAESTIRAIGDNARLGSLIGNRAAIYVARGDYAAARKDYEEAYRLLERAYGATDRRVGSAVMNLAMVDTETGNLEAALAGYGKTLEIYKVSLPARHYEVALTYFNRAIAFANLKRYDEAKQDLELALSIRTEVFGPKHRDVADILKVFGEIEFEQERYAPALERFEAALAIYEETLRPDHPVRVASQASVGRALAGLRRWDEAIAVLEAALAGWKSAGMETPGQGGQARFALASVLWDSRRDRRRALALAKEARDSLASFPDQQKQIDAWLKARTK